MDDTQRIASNKELWGRLLEMGEVSDFEKVLQIVAYPNMLEGLAGMYNHGLLDRSIVKVQVETEAQGFWEAASEWWFDEVRSQPNDNTYRDLEVMIRDLATRKRPEWHRHATVARPPKDPTHPADI